MALPASPPLPLSNTGDLTIMETTGRLAGLALHEETSDEDDEDVDEVLEQIEDSEFCLDLWPPPTTDSPVWWLFVTFFLVFVCSCCCCC